MVKSPTYRWATLPTVEAYDIQISDDPSFSYLVDSAYGVTIDSFVSSVILEESRIYYWRVRPYNKCNAGTYSEVFAFHTIALSCSVLGAQDLPKNISGVGLPTVESTINVLNSATIADISIPNLKGEHDRVKDIEVSLLNPDQSKEIILFSEIPCNTATFNLGLSDDAANPVPCPPTNGTYTPNELFEIFEGDDAAGQWTLRLKVTDNFGAGGFLESWSLKLCTDVNLNGPYIVNNELLKVKPGHGRLLSNLFLLSEDDNNAADELVYTLVKDAQHGDLKIGNTSIETGDQFKQSDIDNDNMEYNNSSIDTASTDHFLFTVSDGEGGWIGITQFNIEMDSNAIVDNVIDVENANSMSFFPNPAVNTVQIQFEQSLKQDATLNVYNTAGQLLRTQVLRRGARVYTMDAAMLANGVYFCRLESDTATLAKKLVIQR